MIDVQQAPEQPAPEDCMSKLKKCSEVLFKSYYKVIEAEMPEYL